MTVIDGIEEWRDTSKRQTGASVSLRSFSTSRCSLHRNVLANQEAGVDSNAASGNQEPRIDRPLPIASTSRPQQVVEGLNGLGGGVSESHGEIGVSDQPASLQVWRAEPQEDP